MASREGGGQRLGRMHLIERIMNLRSVQARRDSDAARAATEESVPGIEALRERLDRFETALYGLQDAVHRETVRQNERIDTLEKRTRPDELSRALSADARRRGL